MPAMANTRVIVDRKPIRRRKPKKKTPKVKRVISDAKADFKFLKNKSQ
jgi:hypothetical protein